MNYLQICCDCFALSQEFANPNGLLHLPWYWRSPPMDTTI